MKAPLLAALMMLATLSQAAAITCQETGSRRAHWSYRIIDGRKCWYKGPRKIARTMLAWPQPPRRSEPRAVPVAPPPPPPPQSSAVLDDDPLVDDFDTRWSAIRTMDRPLDPVFLTPSPANEWSKRK